MLNALWLETFVTLCEAGHFTRAAERLNMTQPGVTQHVKKLEDQVGRPLLSRDGKSFTPTPAGEAILEIGRRRREEDKRFRESLHHDDPNAGEITLACSGSLALLLYPHFMDLMASAPELVIRLEAAPRPRVLAGVADGSFDLGIIDQAPAHARLDGDRIGHDELCLLLPADTGPVPRFAQLQALGFIGHPDGFAYADALLGANFPNDYRGADNLRQRSFVNQIGQIPDPVIRGLGYTILPRSGVGAYPGRQRLTVGKLSHAVSHELWLIQRKARVLPARAERIRDLVEQSVGAL